MDGGANKREPNRCRPWRYRPYWPIVMPTAIAHRFRRDAGAGAIPVRVPDGWTPTHQAIAAAVASRIGIKDPVEPSGPVVWPEFGALVRRHGVGPHVYDSDRLAAYGAPPDLIDGLAQSVWRTRLDAMAKFGLLREILAVLAADDIGVIVLKGLPLAHWGYGDFTSRPSGDIDLVVRPERAPDAVAALTRLGLSEPPMAGQLSPERVDAVLHDLSHVASFHEMNMIVRGTLVDLHWRLTENPHLMPFDADWLAAPATVGISGLEVPTLPPAEAWWYLTVHGTKHEWRSLKWLTDIAAVAIRHPEVCNRASLERATDAGLEHCAAAGMRLAELVFGPFLDDDARAFVDSVASASDLARRSWTTLASPSRSFIPPTQLPGHIRFRLRFRADARYRVAEAKRLVIHTGMLRTTTDPGPLQLTVASLRWFGRALRRTVAERLSRE
jgi:Uncharacterised nucleotidyltransferase